jgi:dipeptidyl aminopeptidase/acylaminoacyl peptidase
MNPTNNLDRELATWLTEQAPPKAPLGVLDGALRQASTVGQRPAWLLPERWIPMQATMRLATFGRGTLYAMLILLLAILLAVAVFVVGQQHLPSPLGLAANGLIANDPQGQITLASSDGQTVRTLSASTEIAVAPAFSPNGQKLAFWSIPRPTDLPPSSSMDDQLSRFYQTPSSLVVVDVANGARTTIASDVQLQDTPLAWSHGSDAIAYMVQFSGGYGKVEIKDLAGRSLGAVELADYPTWSPDDNLLAVRKPTQGVYVFNLASSELKQISQSYGMDDAFALPNWSPDGKRIAFYAGDTPGYTVWIVNVDGSGETKIADVQNGTQAFDPRFSPDGTRLAYLRTGPQIGQGPVTWVVANADGTNPHEFVTDLFPTNAGWSPDGHYLIGYQQYARQVVLINSATGSLLPIGAAGTGNVSWQRLAP